VNDTATVQNLCGLSAIFMTFHFWF